MPTVVGLDPTVAQITEAVRRAGGPVYLRGGADALPFGDGSFDTVVACLVFEHIDAVDDAIAEVARVLEPGGRFVFFLNHPLLQTPGSGWIDDQILDPPEQYWRIGPYLVEAESIEQVTKGVHIRFVHRPLSRYVNAMAEHGLYSSAWRSRRRRRASSLWPRSTPTRRPCPACCSWSWPSADTPAVHGMDPERRGGRP